jgi:hypothetical protein
MSARAARIAVVVGLAAGAGAGCARAQQAPPPITEAGRRDSLARAADYGTLSQNDIVVRLRNDDLDIRFVPLDARITSLLARDAAESLQRLVARHRVEIDSAARAAGVAEPGLALVTFFAQRDGVRFDPQLVWLTFQNRQVRPIATVPLSPAFSSQQLDARGTAMAIYLYEELLPVWSVFTVTYDALVSNDWERRLPTLARERDRLAVRAP